MALQAWNFNYTGSIQSVQLVIPGIYQFIVYGASGGSIAGYNGGYGGFSTGKLMVLAPTTLFVVVGGQGGTTINNTGLYAPGGYNGGGNGYPSGGNTSATQASGGGGGATHIALRSGLLEQLVNFKNDILIVAGGGGGCGVWAGGGASQSGPGGNGGGLSGTNGKNGSNIIQAGGTQTTGFKFGLGQTGAHADSGGGGGGLFGGYANQVKSDSNISGGGGGSGYLRNDLIDAETNTSIHTGHGNAIIQLISLYSLRKNSNFYKNAKEQNVFDFTRIGE